MYIGSNRNQTAAGFHALFSGGVGLLVPPCAYYHKPVALALLIALWLGVQLFMRIRARFARGVFLDEEIELFTWLGAAGFLFGLLVSSASMAGFGGLP